MGLAWAIFSLALNSWGLCLAIAALIFLIELLVVRNYGLAMIFVTPLTVILAAAMAIDGTTGALLRGRILDIVLGSTLGFIGGGVMHHPRWFLALEAKLNAR